MNKKQYINEQEIIRLLDDCYNKDINKIKISIANTKEHEMKKCELCYDIAVAGNRFVTEARFKYNKGRADVLDITEGVAFEVVCSEKEESLVKKSIKYPVPIVVIRV